MLGAFSRPNLEITLTTHCAIAGAGASALIDVLLSNQGPTKLDRCQIDYFVLADGLRGNSRLKSLTLRNSSSKEGSNREVLAVAGALRKNKGLANFDIWPGFTMSDETWYAVCDSLKTHPTLQVLNLRRIGGAPLAPAVLKSWIQALVDMLKVNRSIHTIHLPDRHYTSIYQRVACSLSRDESAPAARPCHPKTSSNCVPCQGSGASSSCCSYKCKSILDTLIRQSGSCLYVDDCDDHPGCEPPYAYCCRYWKCCCCRRYCYRYCYHLQLVPLLLLTSLLARSARHVLRPTYNTSDLPNHFTRALARGLGRGLDGLRIPAQYHLIR